MDWPRGQISLTAAWKENESDHRAYYAWDVAGGFNPLIGAHVRFPFGPLATIPPWLAQYGHAYFFAELKGGLNINLHGGRRTPDEKTVWVDGQGFLTGAIGASLFLMNKNVVQCEVAGTTGITAKARSAEHMERGGVEIEFEWEGLRGEISIEMAWGWVHVQRTFSIVEGGPLNRDPIEIPFPWEH
jgi:hypothetical protein